MKASNSFLLGVVVGVLTVVAIDRARKMIREEDVEALKDRISDSLRSLEGTVSDLAEGITGSLAHAND